MLDCDKLYRLTDATLSTGPGTTYGYDALGNITDKSDVGTYTYHATKKHQVTSTSNGWSFGYDANGNMTSGRNATLTWTSYNYPASITSGADTSPSATRPTGSTGSRSPTTPRVARPRRSMSAACSRR